MTEPAMPRLSTDPATAPRADGLPKRAKTAPAAERPPLELARRIVELAEDKKAADIVLLDLGGLTTMADYFIICSGGSERQLGAIARRHHLQPARREDQADRPRRDRSLALGPGRLRLGDRPHLHAARARVLRPGEALVGGEDDPERPVGELPDGLVHGQRNAVAHARKLIDAKQYVLDSDWGEVAPTADDENAYLRRTPGTSTPPGTSA